MAVSRARYVGFLLLLALLTVQVKKIDSSASWWNLAVTECGRRGGNCPNCAQFLNNTLTEDQAQLCYDDSVPIEAIAKGSQDAIIDCQLRYKNNKWNCSTFFSQDLFGKFVAEASTRETAIIQAYFAAGAVKGVASACHDQKIKNCVCNIDGEAERIDAEGNIIYRDCAEDYGYALNYVLNFIFPELKIEITTTRHKACFSISRGSDGTISTTMEKTLLTDVSTTDAPTADPESEMSYTRVLNDIHNTVVGLKAVNRSEQECACHGLSGSCAVQTCYTKIPEISDIGQDLSLKYGGAIKVIKEENSTNLVSAYTNRDNPSDDDLVYVSESPNFCIRDLANGVVGTEDRLCQPNGDGPDSCQNLCCDNGFYTKTFSVPNEVCRFKWCCYIECVDEGTLDVTEHRCNAARSL